jgi:hypothetical protein
MLSWVVAGLVLMSYATALMFDAYIQAHRSVVSARRTAERVALFASYAAAPRCAAHPLPPAPPSAVGSPRPHLHRDRCACFLSARRSAQSQPPMRM